MDGYIFIVCVLYCVLNCVCAWESKYPLFVTHSCFLTNLSWRKTSSVSLESHLCNQMVLPPAHCTETCLYRWHTQAANISISVSWSPYLVSLLLCRWTWLLCRSSFRRWPSGTRVSPAPVPVRTDSREGWVPLASWTTAWQRRAWTDRTKILFLFKRDSADSDSGWHTRLNSCLRNASLPSNNLTLSAHCPVKNMATWMMHDSLLEASHLARAQCRNVPPARSSVSMVMKKSLPRVLVSKP